MPKKSIDQRNREPGLARRARPQYPSEWRWTRATLPRRLVRGPQIAPPPRATPFDISIAIQGVCTDITRHCPELSHIDINQMIISYNQARTDARRGLLARVTPLRFPGGAVECHRGKHRYRVQRYFVDEVEIRYLLTLCLPRFLNLSFGEKLLTLFHELYHIAPSFAGDLRRLPGRCPLHGVSKKAYDTHMARLVGAYLADRIPKPALMFLRHNYATLTQEHGGVQGIVVPRPRSLPVEEDR